MRMRVLIPLLAAAVLLAGGTFWLGRTAAAHPAATAAAATDPGFAAGRAEGLLEGRADQATVNRPAADKAVFDAGYAAGAADVFAGYDGGWDRDHPYVIVLGPGPAGVTYRIDSRTALEPGVAYYLCPDGHTLCHQPR